VPVTKPKGRRPREGDLKIGYTIRWDEGNGIQPDNTIGDFRKEQRIKHGRHADTEQILSHRNAVVIHAFCEEDSKGHSSKSRRAQFRIQRTQFASDPKFRTEGRIRSQVQN
jgi:hypothetical protein